MLEVDVEPPSDADLAGLLDDERGRASAQERTRQRWLRRQALEEARLSGVLLSAAEHHADVTIRTTAGRSHHGRVELVAGDFCGLRTAAAAVYLRLAAITVVQPERSVQALPAADQRAAAVGTTLQEFLADLAPDHPDVGLVCVGEPLPVSGRLLAVGADVVTLEMDQRRSLIYVALPSLTEVSLGRPSA